MESPAKSPGHSSTDGVAILTPNFNDWGSISRLLREIDATLGAANLQGRVTIVDDGSTEAPSGEFTHQNYSHLGKVEVVRLRCNLGHQRAIAVGLAHLNKTGVGAQAVVVMDGDGEDRPANIPRLLDELRTQQCRVVFAARTKRLEGLFFRLMYFLYRTVHWLLTGVPVRVGNFTAIQPSMLPELLVRHDIWNHYAATILCSRVRYALVPLPREKRYEGESHMRFSALVAHGLSAIAVFGEVVGARLILFFSGVMVLALGLLGFILGVRFFTPVAVPAWAPFAVGLLILFTAQALLSILVLALIVLGDRSQARIIPLRDAELFIESVTSLPYPA